MLSSIKKGVKKAKKKLITVPMNGTTIPFAITVKLGAAQVVLKPAPMGSGIIAGGPVRAVVDAAGIRDISSKIKGTNNQASNVYATFEALKQIRQLVDVKNIKLKSLEDVESEQKLKDLELIAKEKEREVTVKKTEPVVEKKKTAPKTAIKKPAVKK